MVAKIEIKGLREFQASVRRLDSGLPKTLRLVLNEAVTEVIDYAQPRVPRRTGRAAASMKARSSQREARIAVGGRKAPYYPGLDFGGGRPQFPPYQPGGRYVYKALEVKHEQVTEIMSRGLTELARTAGLEVH